MPHPGTSVGVQVKAPPAVMAAPAGAPPRLKVKVWAGRSASLAPALKESGRVSLTFLIPIAAKTGATLTSDTVTVMASQVSRVPSEIQTEKGYTPGPCASVGVQLNMPLLDPMEAPPGALVKLKVSVWGGASGSEPVAEKVRLASSAIFLLPIEFNTGGSLSGLTVMLMVAGAEVAKPSKAVKVKLSGPM